MTVDQCAEQALCRANKGDLTVEYTYNSDSTSQSRSNTKNTTSTTPTTPPPFGPFWWSYNFPTRKCFEINLNRKAAVSTTVGWVSGSPACGVNADSSDVTPTCPDSDDREARLFPKLIYLGDKNSLHFCERLCAEENYNFIGVENGDECRCGNDLPPFDKLADQAQCNKECPGNKNQICGGHLRMNVYSI
jgi:hypothetical protein